MNLAKPTFALSLLVAVVAPLRSAPVQTLPTHARPIDAVATHAATTHHQQSGDCGDWYDDASDESDWYDDEGWYDDGGQCDDGWVDDGASDDSSAGSEVLATFAVRSEALDTRGSNSALARTATRIWNRFVALIPRDRRPRVTSFELLESSDTSAWVYENDNTTWTLGVARDLADGWELDSTLIHETGHLVTLNTDQIRSGGGSCTTYRFEPEGCARAGSIADRFMRQFWTTAMRAAANRGDDLSSRYPGSFVSEYAGTDPAEDIAETFAAFVMKPRPSGHRVADDKVNLFWADTDMVSLRSAINANRGR